jgi:deoxyribonuclease-1
MIRRALWLLLPLSLLACGEEATQTPDNQQEIDLGDGDTAEDQAEDQPAPEDTSAPDAPEEQGEEDEEEVPDAGPDLPEDPYASTEGLDDAALKDALYDLVKGHRSFGYNGARDLMYGVAGSIDVIDGQLECIYTAERATPDGSRTPGNLNTEHSWPQNDGADLEPARSDLHHLFPSQERANQERGNHPFGQTNCNGPSCEWEEGGSQLGAPAAGGSGYVFEVRAPRRGDIARAHFYFSVRYQLEIPAAEERDLRRWHDEDPPDDRERDRNDAIASYQNNRNPFIDRPDLVARIADF